ncbi:MAG: hypothetical protein UZ22_OP11002000146 [Microgenomates bacterium OLB23]|nr:MAG: hypothetical protein UZ22_OP11002000146 [Microgenomates bacterium OLB23]
MTEKVEYMFLKQLVEGLKDGSLQPAQAQEYARAFLKFEPFQNFEDAKAKMTTFAQQYPLFTTLQDYINAYHYEQKVDSVIQKMQEYIGQDKVEEAIQVAQSE